MRTTVNQESKKEPDISTKNRLIQRITENQATVIEQNQASKEMKQTEANAESDGNDDSKQQLESQAAPTQEDGINIFLFFMI